MYVCTYLKIRYYPVSFEKHVIHRAFQEESAVLRENVLSLMYLYSELNSYGGNIARKVWSSCGSTYSACVTWCVIRTLRRFVLEPIAKPSHTETSVIYKVRGTLRIIFLKLMRVSCLINVCMSLLLIGC